MLVYLYHPKTPIIIINMLNPLDEELLEPLAREFRFQAGLNHIPKDTPIDIVDLGCGPKMRFFHRAVRSGVKVKTYTGIDPLVKKTEIRKLPTNTKILVKKMKKSIPLPAHRADLVVGFAFLEHISHPAEILRDTLRVLRPSGLAVFTTPTPKAKNILETLSYKLKIISRREIEEHKNYFDKNSLLKMLKPVRANCQIQHHYFEFGCNNLLVIRKNQQLANIPQH